MMDSPGPSKQDHYRTKGQARKGRHKKKYAWKWWKIFPHFSFSFDSFDWWCVCLSVCLFCIWRCILVCDGCVNGGEYLWLGYTKCGWSVLSVVIESVDVCGRMNARVYTSRKWLPMAIEMILGANHQRLSACSVCDSCHLATGFILSSSKICQTEFSEKRESGQERHGIDTDVSSTASSRPISFLAVQMLPTRTSRRSRSRSSRSRRWNIKADAGVRHSFTVVGPNQYRNT